MPGQSLPQIFLHFVWTTHRRAPLLEQELEQPVYACIVDEARRFGCEVLAIGGMADHVHVAVRMSAIISPAELAKRMKGVSSALVRRRLRPDRTFRWQNGYGVFSFSHSHRDRVTRYVHTQREHHSRGSLWTPWERPAQAPERAAGSRPSGRP